MAVNAEIAHRLLDILSVILFTAAAYFILRMTATEFGPGEKVAVVTMFLAAVSEKLGFRLLHGKVK